MNDIDDIIVQGEPIYYAHTLSPKLKEVWILPISDVHYGNPLFSKPHFLRTIKFIEQNSKVYTVCNGDLCESTLRASKGDIYRQVGTPQDQRDWITEKLYPIRKKILGFTDGNHEWRIYNEVGIAITKDIAKELNAPYRPEGLLLKISFGDNNRYTADKPYVYWSYQTHGYGGARTKSAKAVKVERVATYFHADFYIMSHDHVVNVAPDVYLIPDPRTNPEKDKDGNETGFTVGKVIAHRKMLVKSNSYVKFGGYAEMGGFSPSDLIPPIIKLAGVGKPRVRVEI